MKLNDDGSRGDAGAASEKPSWIDRHLGKIIVAAAIMCALGLIARAVTG